MLSVGAMLSVLVDGLGLSIGVSDSVEVVLPGAVVLPLVPQAAAVSAASPRRSANAVLRMGTSFPWVQGVGPVWSRAPG